MSYFNSINQNVVTDSNNSSTANLAAGASFTGTGSSTLGVAGIQVSLKTSQNCTVRVEQSTDNSNWDIVDSFDYLYSNGGNGWTVQAINSYVRVVVTNNGGSTTSFFRLQTALCPIVEALPRSLNDDGNLKVAVQSIEDDYGFEAEMTAIGEMRVAEPVRLVGTSFESALDTNFWTTTVTGSGAISASGQAVIITGIVANSTAQLQSVRKNRQITSTMNRFRCAIRLPDLGQTNNIRRWGVFDANNGAFFQLSGTTFSVVTRKGGIDTAVNSGSFNGSFGASFALNNDYDTYEIYITSRRVFFVAGNELIHTVTAGTSTIVNSYNVPITVTNDNSGGSTTDVAIYVLHASIYRIGKLGSDTIYKNIAGASTNTLKLGPGRLIAVVNNTMTPGASTVTIYDNTSAAGTLMATITLTSSAQLVANVGAIRYNCPFSTGLTVVTTGANNNITVVYE